MEVGIPMSIQSTYGEFVFNSLNGSPVSISDPPDFVEDGGHLYPNVSDGGALMQSVTGLDGAGIRNPTSIKPHKGGAIIHKFHRTERIFTLEGLIVANNPSDRQAISDQLKGVTDALVGTDGRFFYTPPGVTSGTRFLTVQLYDMVEINGPGASTGSSPSDIAGPKLYTVTLVAPDWRAYTYAEDDTSIEAGSTVTVPNDGNTETWPVCQVSGADGGALTAFTLTNETTGFAIEWTGSVSAGHYIEINMLDETMYVDGNGANKLGGLNLAMSDFWSIQPGGVSVSSSAYADVLIKSNDAWV